MKVMDAFIPVGALAPSAEARLMKELTDILVSIEGIEPENEAARAASVIFLHRPVVFVGGAPSALPRYRFVPSLAKGDGDVLRLVEKAVQEAVARAERTSFEDARRRVRVTPWEIPDWEDGGAVDSARIFGSLSDSE